MEDEGNSTYSQVDNEHGLYPTGDYNLALLKCGMKNRESAAESYSGQEKTGTR
jgi:hypothetical protein